MAFFFFFKQKTAYELRISDWSSDVCSSDLLEKSTNTKHGIPTDASSGFVVDARMLFVLFSRKWKGSTCFCRISRIQPLEWKQANHAIAEIGRASCRERVWQYV